MIYQIRIEILGDGTYKNNFETLEEAENYLFNECLNLDKNFTWWNNRERRDPWIEEYKGDFYEQWILYKHEPSNRIFVGYNPPHTIEELKLYIRIHKYFAIGEENQIGFQAFSIIEKVK